MENKRKQETPLQKRKNKKGQVGIVAFMLGLTIIIVALSFAPGVKTQVDTSMNADNLDCDNSTISNFNKISCLAVDMNIPLVVGGFIFIGGAIILARIVI